ncbi:PHP domain-containing protein [Paenibacillus frigoriresistens]|uniref:PHP domain-containing protein n=1 Tax=Paenibacillus alginolyticus TaxID=59839 RepID=UPI00156486D2|nr:PHP domain-containing protein [Paenibacillus frigoriresistens]NRF96273.1 PHP domain-containing protein [Paenibacillus frigoriresistens]
MIDYRKKFDLHMHTTASDGDYPPATLVKKAAELGLQIIAITDHDTLDGITEAQRIGCEAGVEVIAGVELSSKYEGKTIDILGYQLAKIDDLNQTLSRMRRSRENRAQVIVEEFNAIGMSITMDDVLEFSQGGVIARPHIAKAIVKKGYISDYQTVFDEYLADGKPCAIDKTIITPVEAIALIHDAGGKAVLAHPVYLQDDEFVERLLRFPFDGIEVWHRSHKPEDVIRYKGIAQKYKLMMTGGSDFHNDAHNLGSFGYTAEGNK